MDLAVLHDRFEKETSARNAAEDQLKHVERRLHEKESHIVVISKERKELEKRIRDLEAQVKQLQGDLDHAKGECESEMLRRVDAENKLLSLQETLDFNEQVHQKVMRVCFLINMLKVSCGCCFVLSMIQPSFLVF